MTELTTRELQMLLYQEAVDAVDGQYRVQRWLADDPQRFSHCVAIGKAAPAMLQGALNACPSLSDSLLIAPGQQISRALRKNSAVRCMASSHPVPDEKSLQAGEALLQFLRQLPEQAELLFLISGGASSLVEVLVDGISLEQCDRINRYLLASGKPIHQINGWRRRYSKIKAGGLLRYIHIAHCTQLLLSDVKDDDVSVIGSGLLVESQSIRDDDSYLDSIFKDKSSQPENETLDNNKHSVTVTTEVIGTLDHALEACAQSARSEGLPVIVHKTFLEGEVSQVAWRLASYLKQAPRGIHLWGGETTVQLPDKPGIGGRNQSLALNVAVHLAGTDIHLLAAGTDGIDGNSNCAGAAVSARTIEKARSMGIDVNEALERANAGMVLMATDDLIQPGPTNTNVMDIVIAYVP